MNTAKYLSLAIFIALLVGCGKSGPTIDATTEESFEDTTEIIHGSLPSELQDEFSFMLLSAVGEAWEETGFAEAWENAGTPSDFVHEELDKAIKRRLHGLTGDEVIKKYRKKYGDEFQQKLGQPSRNASFEAFAEEIRIDPNSTIADLIENPAENKQAPTLDLSTRQTLENSCEIIHESLPDELQDKFKFIWNAMGKEIEETLEESSKLIVDLPFDDLKKEMKRLGMDLHGFTGLEIIRRYGPKYEAAYKEHQQNLMRE